MNNSLKMKKTLPLYLVKIILGIIICRMIIFLINLIVGYSLSYLIDNETITLNKASELLETFIIIYLPILVVFIILGISILRDYIKNRKFNIIWKVIVLIFSYLLFEFW